MKILIKITKEDIRLGIWENHYCPEALAIKRALKEKNIHCFSVGVESKKACSKITFYYGEHVDTDTFSPKQSVIMVKGLCQWSSEFDKTQQQTLSPYGGVHYNTKYTGKNIKDIKPFKFEIEVPQEVIDAPDFDWLRNHFSELDLCTHSHYNIQNIRDEEKVLKKIKKCGFDLHRMQCGELSRFNFEDSDKVWSWKQDKNKRYNIKVLKKDDNNEIMASSYGWLLADFYDILDRSKIFAKKNKAKVFVALRYVCFGTVEASVIISK